MTNINAYSALHGVINAGSENQSAQRFARIQDVTITARKNTHSRRKKTKRDRIGTKNDKTVDIDPPLHKKTQRNTNIR